MERTSSNEICLRRWAMASIVAFETSTNVRADGVPPLPERARKTSQKTAHHSNRNPSRVSIWTLARGRSARCADSGDDWGGEVPFDCAANPKLLSDEIGRASCRERVS